MGQKTNPIGFRIGINRTWFSQWFDERQFAQKLAEDILLRNYLEQRLHNAALARVEIERWTDHKVKVILHTARPGVVIGKKGADVEKLNEELRRITKKEIDIEVQEVKKPELEASLVAEAIARQLEARVSFRRAMKRALQASRRMGAEGVKISCSGRLGGAEMHRRETYKEGRIPLHTLRADIDYAVKIAYTNVGTVGIKVWICRGEILSRDELKERSSR